MQKLTRCSYILQNITSFDLCYSYNISYYQNCDAINLFLVSFFFTFSLISFRICKSITVFVKFQKAFVLIG